MRTGPGSRSVHWPCPTVMLASALDEHERQRHAGDSSGPPPPRRGRSGTLARRAGLVAQLGSIRAGQGRLPDPSRTPPQARSEHETRTESDSLGPSGRDCRSAANGCRGSIPLLLTIDSEHDSRLECVPCRRVRTGAAGCATMLHGQARPAQYEGAGPDGQRRADGRLGDRDVALGEPADHDPPSPDATRDSARGRDRARRRRGQPKGSPATMASHCSSVGSPWPRARTAPSRPTTSA